MHVRRTLQRRKSVFAASYVWKVEAGERRIDPIEFVAWCQACGVRPSKAIEQLVN